MIVSYNNVLGLNVSQELKNKIINGQYVDLAKMFVNSNEPQKQSLVMVNGELQATEKNAKNITNIFNNGQMLLSYLQAFIWRVILLKP